MALQHSKHVSYIVDSELLKHCDAIPIIKHRALMTHSLIASYGLLDKLSIVSSVISNEDEIRGFHSQDYVEYLKNASDNTNDIEEDEFGLGFDCPVIERLWPMVCRIAGASLTAARQLTSEKSNVAINWCGGWHHAQRDSAAGFCYVNDIVLAIQHLRTKFDRILYIDLDIHHGDGVENAFLFSPKVLTLSLHQLEPGFFPGTGNISDVGSGRGRFCSVNVPYKSGINDSQFIFLFESIVYSLCETFYPNAIVTQCGGDVLSGDPLGAGNVTLRAFTSCIRNILTLNKPTLFLGGGGYNKVNCAKMWAHVTSIIVNHPLVNEIPEHEFFPLYGPSFELEITPSLRKSENTQAYLDDAIKIVQCNIESLSKTQRHSFAH